MNPASAKLLDVVAFLAHKPAENLIPGQVGTIVETLAPDVFEVEFCNSDGRTVGLAELRRDEFLVSITNPRLNMLCPVDNPANGSNSGSMSDDLHKRYVDKRFLALKEDYEVKTFEKDVKEERPSATSAEIHSALVECGKTFPSNHPREKIMKCVLSEH